MKTTITTILLLSFGLFLNAQTQGTREGTSIYNLAPFDRAVCCIKYYEGIHRKKDYPYVGYGHQLQPGEHYSSCMSLAEAEALLRKDLKKLCSMFRGYGKDSLLLATLAYNIGPYRILGNRGRHPRPKSTLLKKIESGIRNFKQDYVQFCRWRGKKVASIERRRRMEWMLLYTP
jgi:lysozyme